MLRTVTTLIFASAIALAVFSIGFFAGARWTSALYSQLYAPTAQEATP